MPDEKGGRGSKLCRVVGGEEAYGGGTAELSLKLGVSVEVVDQAGSNVLSLGYDLHVRRRVGAYLI